MIKSDCYYMLGTNSSAKLRHGNIIHMRPRIRLLKKWRFVYVFPSKTTICFNVDSRSYIITDFKII